MPAYLTTSGSSLELAVQVGLSIGPIRTPVSSAVAGSLDSTAASRGSSVARCRRVGDGRGRTGAPVAADPYAFSEPAFVD